MIVRRQLMAIFCLAWTMSPIASSPLNAAEESSKTVKKAENESSDKVAAQQKPELVEVSLAGKQITLKLPKAWKSKRPRSRIVEREFAVPKVTGDDNDGRLTMMRSGGSIAANVDRWISQFSQPDGKSTKDIAKVTKKKLNDQDAILVNITGTFSESMGGGPFAPGKTVRRSDYQMLGGIVQTKASGQYFFKLYGPKKTMAAAEKQFMAMMESIRSTAKP